MAGKPRPQGDYDRVSVKVEKDEQSSCAFTVLRLKPDVYDDDVGIAAEICTIEMQPVGFDIGNQTSQDTEQTQLVNAQGAVTNTTVNSDGGPNQVGKQPRSQQSKRRRQSRKGTSEIVENGIEKSKGKRLGKKVSTCKKTLKNSSNKARQWPCEPEVTQVSDNATVDGQKRFKCGICLKEFNLVGHLTRHMRVHSSDRPFKCDECGKAFKDSSVLMRHQKIHQADRPYKCKVCKKTFIQNKDLTNHKRVHTGARPYQCETCNKTFSSASYLTVHVRIHSGEKPFSCEICQLAFTSSTTLTRHNRTHTGEKPYKCDICGKAFTRPATLKKHQGSHNSSDTE